MNRRFTVLPLSVMLLCSAAAPGDRVPSDSLGIVPQPRSVTAYAATYTLPHRVRIAASGADERNVAQFAVGFFRERGIEAAIVSNAPAAELRLSKASPGEIVPEGYTLHAGSDGIAISASNGAGLFYGLQTLEQLFSATGGNAIHYAEIADAPAFRWRGIHLDVSRHFYGVPVVERYIDVAAHYKLNTFHWHLTDDQGWRIEIKRYPKLAQIGSCRAGTQVDKDPTDIDGKRYCGFYTQNQIREVLQYAKRRYVTIVPEVEMPGHSTAALAAYPQYACSRGPFHVAQTWGVLSEIYCPTEATFTFLDNVLTEVASLFPGTYFHVGGDEVPKEAWRKSAFVHSLMQREHLRTYNDVQGYFERRIERHLNTLHRRMVGWDEILDAGVTQTATVMSWRGDVGGIRAAKRGNDVVMSPDGPLYFDAYQGDENDEPEAIGNLSTPQMIYDYNPAPPSLTPAQSQHVLGVQGNLWTEYIANEPYLFYMLLPRELALSEIAWTAPAQKNWDSFVARTGSQYAWLDAHRYNYRIPNPRFLTNARLLPANVSPSVRTVSAETDAASADVSIEDDISTAAIRYTMDGTMPTTSSPLFTQPLHYALQPGQVVTITAAAVLENGRISTPSQLILRRLAR
jgi:hexosaminidase